MFNLYEAEQLGRIRREEALRDAEIRRLVKEAEANCPGQPNAIQSTLAVILTTIRSIGHARPIPAKVSEQAVPC